MKALILAAGHGERLKPYTDVLPKPLFPIGGRPLLDAIIDRLLAAGCSGLAVNTHHLAARIESHIRSRSIPIPVHLLHEPRILGTGGAIRNAARIWPREPLLVVNGDIHTDIDLAAVSAFHHSHPHPVTMVMHDYSRFNTVSVSRDRFVTGFDVSEKELRGDDSLLTMAFTGIHVIDPDMTADLPADTFIDIKEVYRNFVRNGGRIAAFTVTGHAWDDIGTPEQYRDAVMRAMSPEAFAVAHEPNGSSEPPGFRFTVEPIAGDGSDRFWYRLHRNEHTLIVADHHIQTDPSVTEFDSFIRIGDFLRAGNIPVPRIYLSNRFSGLVFMEDLGDGHLQAFVQHAPDQKTVFRMYESVIDILIAMSRTGANGFDASWCWQTQAYDRKMILDKEILYFINAFLNGCLNLCVAVEDASSEWERIIQGALSSGLNGFMHRDLQSRNIMVRNSRPYLIDFQGGRMGPLQYDLASLLIDPYVHLPASPQDDLLDACIKKLQCVQNLRTADFLRSYRHCALTRNMQMLGAFGFLSRVKHKHRFAKYIPIALETLETGLRTLQQQGEDYPVLRSWAARAIESMKNTTIQDLIEKETL